MITLPCWQVKLDPVECCSCFCNDTPPTEIYSMTQHDALPICAGLEELTHWDWSVAGMQHVAEQVAVVRLRSEEHTSDSSHQIISYAVFCLKKKSATVALPTLHTVALLFPLAALNPHHSNSPDA